MLKPAENVSGLYENHKALAFSPLLSDMQQKKLIHADACIMVCT
jgi:hypothetical protein